MPKSKIKKHTTQKPLQKKQPKKQESAQKQTSPQVIFGPVLSRRFGRSLGVDLSPSTKQCNFDCVYCELYKAKPMESMREVFPYQQILSEIENALKIHKDISVLTFTATGEPTLYPQLFELITATKPLLPPHIKTLILSNGSRFYEQKKALQLFDIVKFSLDAGILSAFKKIDRPSHLLSLEKILKGIEDFSAEYGGELVAEVLLVEGHNDSEENLRAIADFLRKVRISRVDLGSIDRPSAYQVKSVSEEKLHWASKFFDNLNLSLPRRNQIQTNAQIQSNPTQNCKISHPKSSPKSNTNSNLTFAKNDTKSTQDFAKSSVEKQHYDKKKYDKDSLLKFLSTRPVEKNEATMLFSPSTLKLLDSLLCDGTISLKSQPPYTFYTTK